MIITTTITIITMVINVAATTLGLVVIEVSKGLLNFYINWALNK